MTLRPQQPDKKNKQRKAHRSAVPLDATALETLKLLVRALERCGFSAQDVARQCETFEGQSQPQTQHGHSEEEVSRGDWVQIMNLWSLDPDYLDPEGRPVPLHVRGTAPSVEALLERVDSKLSPEEVCHQMLSTGVAREEKNRLVSMAHAPIIFPTGSAEQSAHHLHLLHSVLLNIEHNAAPPDGVRWVERESICHTFPESALAAYSAAAKERAQAFLVSENATMHRIATFTPPDGRTMEATVHILFSARPTDSTTNSDGPGARKAAHAKAIQPRRHSARASRKPPL